MTNYKKRFRKWILKVGGQPRGCYMSEVNEEGVPKVKWE